MYKQKEENLVSLLEKLCSATTCSPRETEVLKLYYGRDMNLKEIGNHKLVKGFGHKITSTRVNGIRKKAERKIERNLS